MLIIIFSKRGQRRLIEASGKFNCPRCESPQPCEHVKWVETTRLFGLIPIGAPELLEEYVQCITCEGREPMENYVFNSENGFFEMVQWDCPYCKHLNPNTRYKCRSCGKSLI